MERTYIEPMTKVVKLTSPTSILAGSLPPDVPNPSMIRRKDFDDDDDF